MSNRRRPTGIAVPRRLWPTQVQLGVATTDTDATVAEACQAVHDRLAGRFHAVRRTAIRVATFEALMVLPVLEDLDLDLEQGDVPGVVGACYEHPHGRLVVASCEVEPRRFTFLGG